MLFNYSIGDSLTTPKKENKKQFSKKAILISGIIINLSLLAYFKYADFFIVNINSVSGSTIPLLELALPLAISFFTFQQIAYLVDSYRGETGEYDFLNYALFVTFFPQLIAGPIVHHKEMMPQFASTWNLVKNYKNIALGLFVFSIGLFKKVVIADTFSVWATQGFDVAETLNLFEAWATSLSYTFQLYFDFSGYTDMAIGVALLFNIKLPMNFNSPYKAKNIQEFWRRWHITLSRFLRDYIYIPLGGNRGTSFRTYSNLITTFILGGLWHGAGWTFILWGVLHGFALAVHKLWQSLGFKMWGWIAWFITFNFVNIAWVFFRAKEWDDAVKVLGAMFSLDYLVLPNFLASKFPILSHYDIEFGGFLANIHADMFIIVWLFIGFVLILMCKNTMQIGKNFKSNTLSALLLALLFVITLSDMNKISEFLYFNF